MAVFRARRFPKEPRIQAKPRPKATNKAFGCQGLVLSPREMPEAIRCANLNGSGRLPVFAVFDKIAFTVFSSTVAEILSFIVILSNIVYY